MNAWKWARIVVIAGGLVGLSSASQGVQEPDFTYNPVLPSPVYAPRRGPVVAVDTTHDNFHTISNRYLGFNRLLTADGYRVRDFSVPFPTDADLVARCLSHPLRCRYIRALKKVDTLVIGNARSPVSLDESQVIARWVAGEFDRCTPHRCRRRSLFLIADHQHPFCGGIPCGNFPLHIANLSNALGLNWPNNNVEERTFTAAPPHDPGTGGILDTVHPIVKGRSAAEEVLSVRAFYGSGFTASRPGATSLMTMPAGSFWFNASFQPVNGEGYSQGMVFDHGRGRVYASGEAGMFTAQNSDGYLWGMQVTPYNEQYLLNIMHWFDGF